MCFIGKKNTSKRNNVKSNYILRCQKGQQVVKCKCARVREVLIFYRINHYNPFGKQVALRGENNIMKLSFFRPYGARGEARGNPN